MSEILLHPSSIQIPSTGANPLPQLLQTPSGLAILELQGTINLPDQPESSDPINLDGETSIGRLVFPFYDAKEADGGAGWMKKVWLYVGKHQRLTGEVKKLPKPLAVIRKRRGEGEEMELEGEREKQQELEVVEIVKYKILFSLRPEPVGTSALSM